MGHYLGQNIMTLTSIKSMSLAKLDLSLPRRVKASAKGQTRTKRRTKLRRLMAMLMYIKRLFCCWAELVLRAVKNDDLDVQ